jgi:hypothetical protein
MEPVHFSATSRACHLKISCLWLTLAFFTATVACGASVEEQIAAVKAQKDAAVASVQQIVNQPVTHLKQTPDMSVSVYSPGWFHDGAGTPDFDNVDVRKTQELTYQEHTYVTSDLNPGEVFLGNELEFNSMTKYFYTDRSLPKKKLTEAEMLQINDLYRVIGRCNKELEELQNPESQLTKIHEVIAAHKPVAVVVAAVLLALFIVLRIRRAAT